MSFYLMYACEHLWVETDKEVAVIGVTEYGQELLGDVVFIELPEPGRIVACGQELCSIESLKIVTTISSPCNGEIIQVNENLLGQPELLNEDPYKEGWLVKVRYVSLKENLITPEEYERYIKEQKV